MFWLLDTKEVLTWVETPYTFYNLMSNSVSMLIRMGFPILPQYGAKQARI
jgi:hypothetical protein